MMRNLKPGISLEDEKAARRELTREAPSIMFTTEPSFFSKRDHSGVCVTEFSQQTFDAVMAKFQQVIIICYHIAPHLAPLQHDDRVTIILVNDKMNGATAAQDVLHTLKKLNIRMHVPTDMRSITIFRLKQLIVDSRVVVTEINDHEKLGITAEKLPAFEDLAKQRAKTGWI
jgi:hypothetical protein